ncbi:MAG TPA: response regulator [Methylomirabilota bacterium]|nr:response regulator [Methylomirabilota bacterium]
MDEQIAPEPTLATILVIEDDEQQLRLYRKTLKEFRVVHATTGTEGLGLIEEHRPSVILLDHILAEGEKGTDFLPKLKRIAPHVPVIVISGTLDIQGQLKALQGPHSAHYVIEKPVSVRELRKTVEIALTECGVAETIAVLQSLERHELVRSEGSERRFTRRLARQHEMLLQLRQSQGRPNISELARQHEVDRKTIIRDLHDLIDRGQLDPSVYPEWKSAAAEVS